TAEVSAQTRLRADGGNRAFLFRRIPPATEHGAKRLLPVYAIGRSTAEINHHFTFDVFAGVIAAVGQAQAVTEEFDLLGGEAALTADVSRKADAFFVLEGARLAARFNRHRRLVIGFDAAHGDALKVGTVRPAGFDAQRFQLTGDIPGGQSQPFAEGVAPLEFI